MKVSGRERIITEIKGSIQNTLNPPVVAVVIETQHMCTSMWGILK